jgi:hypothetical protein
MAFHCHSVGGDLELFYPQFKWGQAFPAAVLAGMVHGFVGI